YTVGLWLWHNRVAITVSTWYAMPGGRGQLTPAGYWYVFISIPILQFILLRWYVRFFIWFRFLWQVSKIDLNLIPTHPDRAAGLAFLGKSVYAQSFLLKEPCSLVSWRVEVFIGARACRLSSSRSADLSRSSS